MSGAFPTDQQIIDGLTAEGYTSVQKLDLYGVVAWKAVDPQSNPVTLNQAQALDKAGLTQGGG